MVDCCGDHPGQDREGTGNAGAMFLRDAVGRPDACPMQRRLAQRVTVRAGPRVPAGSPPRWFLGVGLTPAPR
jgi:hypothetical protein